MSMPRRTALRTVSAALVAGVASTAAATGAHATSASPPSSPSSPSPQASRLDPPPDARATTSTVGKKWYRDGTPMRFRGNTFIHHLDPGCSLASAATDVRRQLLEDPLGALFTTLPPDSYHVTFLDGTDETQRKSSRWPGDIPRDAPMDDVSRRYLQKLQSARISAPAELQFAVRGVTDITDAKKGLSVALEPDAPSAAALRNFRARVLQELHLDVPVDGYDYHVTLAYRLYDHTPAEKPRLAALRDQFAASLPSAVQIDGCDFTTFENMVGFPTLLPLRW